MDGFSDLLMQHARGTLDEKGMRYLTTISASAKNMGRLIDDLLALSRMGRTQMQSDTVELDGLVREVRSELEGVDPARRIEWRIEPLPTVHGDRGLLKLAFMNLLANAVKYSRSRENAVIEIGTRPGDHEDVIHVRDNGVGFDMKYQHKLFGVFQRLHRDDEFEGTGIGLATVRRIVGRHGGRTWAEGALAQGATFYMALPRASQKEDQEAA
jgi:light-regulated signal transduction histidine kinase (bacteriophytochrome)